MSLDDAPVTQDDLDQQRQDHELGTHVEALAALAERVLKDLRASFDRRDYQMPMTQATSRRYWRMVRDAQRLAIELRSLGGWYLGWERDAAERDATASHLLDLALGPDGNQR